MEISHTQGLSSAELGDGLNGTPPSSDTPDDAAEARKRGLVATGSVVGALLASSCCILPLVLFSLGIGGAWISNLTGLYPYKPYFLGITALFLAGGFYMTYRKPKAACAAGSYCASPTLSRVLQVALWGSTLLVGAVLIFPYVAPYLLGN